MHFGPSVLSDYGGGRSCSGTSIGTSDSTLFGTTGDSLLGLFGRAMVSSPLYVFLDLTSLFSGSLSPGAVMGTTPVLSTCFVYTLEPQPAASIYVLGPSFLGLRRDSITFGTTFLPVITVWESRHRALNGSMFYTSDADVEHSVPVPGPGPTVYKPPV